MLEKYLFISALLALFYGFNNIYCIKICDPEDCMVISLCPEAESIAKNKSSNQIIRDKFLSSACGVQLPSKNMSTMVCCSDFKVLNASNGQTPTHTQVEEVEIHFMKHENIKLLPKICGEYTESRLVGGNVADLYEFPWIALIATRNNGYRTIEFSCGGTIINSRYILTAAQCVDNQQIMGVRLGEYHMHTRIDCQGENPNFICEDHVQDTLIEKTIIHENYQASSTRSNNIALLRTKDDINFSFRNVAPICLPVYKELIKSKLDRKIAGIAGWGIPDTNVRSVFMSKAFVTVLSDSECGEGDNKMIICANGRGQEACRGDLGGPLMYPEEYNTTNRMIQYGIDIRGPEECSIKSNPRIYTNVQKYIWWILNNIEE